MNLSMVLFLIGILGFILNRKNIILILISLEILLLAVTKLLVSRCLHYSRRSRLHILPGIIYSNHLFSFIASDRIFESIEELPVLSQFQIFTAAGAESLI